MGSKEEYLRTRKQERVLGTNQVDQLQVTIYLDDKETELKRPKKEIRN